MADLSSPRLIALWVRAAAPDKESYQDSHHAGLAKINDQDGRFVGQIPWLARLKREKLFVSFLTFGTTIYELNQPKNIWIKLFP
jgi:hypothetical protein